MSKPLPTSHPMFRMIEKQLVQALTDDLQVDRLTPSPLNDKGLGIHAKGVLAEILGAVVTQAPEKVESVSTLCSKASLDGMRCALVAGHPGAHAMTRSVFGTGPVRFVTEAHRKSLEENGHFAGPLTYMPSAYAKLEAELKEAHAEIERLTGIIHTPENDEFLTGTAREAEFQRQHHGVDNSEEAFDWPQWYWVAGYLLGKAWHALKQHNTVKAKHHLVTTAALLYNWHNLLSSRPAASVHSNSGKAFVDRK
jgi:hypothetical protein